MQPLDVPPAVPVMAGGTGRSGTTVVAGLLGRHPDVRASVPREVKFLTEPAGLLDVCVGPRRHSRHRSPRRVRLVGHLPVIGPPVVRAEFARQMRGRWWRRTNRMGRDSGLHLGLDEATRDHLLEQLWRDHAAVGGGEAGRRFFQQMVRSQKQDAGERYWIDTSPPNVAEADRMLALLPDVRIIWMVRDGRSTAASVLRERWGPNDPAGAVAWWEARLRESHAGIGGLPQGRLLVQSLEDLVVRDRESSYRRLLDFLGLEDDPAMRRFFERRMPPDRVRPDAWRDRVADPVAFEGAYLRARDRLERDGLATFEVPVA